MRHHLRLASLLTLCACSGANPALVVNGDEDAPLPVDQRTLGMNDVSLLLPLPTSLDAPVLLRASDPNDEGDAILPRALWERIIVGPPLFGGETSPDVFAEYEDLHVVAVRFDLCNRKGTGRCAADAPGQLRLVLQAVETGPEHGPFARDISLHALYSFPNDELPDTIAALRALARTAGGATTAPLQPSPALVADPAGAYATQLRTLVKRLARPERIERLTFLAQPDVLAAIVWRLRGLDRDGDDYTEHHIPTVDEIDQQIMAVGAEGTFEITPTIDEPIGLVSATAPNKFAGAGAAIQRGALAALAIAENPLMRTADTVQCAACHLSTVSAHLRASEAGLALADVTERYLSAYDLSVAAGQNVTSDRTIRAFGWMDRNPFIAQRVANETAHTLVELEARYPAR